MLGAASLHDYTMFKTSISGISVNSSSTVSMRTNTTPTGTPPPQNNPQIETKTRGYKQTKKHPQNNKQTNKQTKYRQTPINCKVWHQLTKQKFPLLIKSQRMTEVQTGIKCSRLRSPDRRKRNKKRNILYWALSNVAVLNEFFNLHENETLSRWFIF